MNNMDINFDFRSFQNEIANKFSQCISESFEDEDTNMQDVSDSIDEKFKVYVASLFYHQFILM